MDKTQILELIESNLNTAHIACLKPQPHTENEQLLLSTIGLLGLSLQVIEGYIKGTTPA